MAQWTGQDLATVPKWLGVQTFISDRWPHSPLGPACSFVQDRTTGTAFGCAPSDGHYVCGQSADRGRTWTVRDTADRWGGREGRREVGR